MVGVLVVEHRLLPELADKSDLVLLPPATAAKMPGHFETVKFHPVPADPDAQAKPAICEQIDISGLLGKQRRLALREDDHAGYEFEFLGDAREIGVGDQWLVERIAFLMRAGQFRFSASMLSAEHMVVDDDVVVTQDFRRLCEGFDRSSIAA